VAPAKVGLAQTASDKPTMKGKARVIVPSPGAQRGGVARIAARALLTVRSLPL
jgi:hypothetical protein